MGFVEGPRQNALQWRLAQPSQPPLLPWRISQLAPVEQSREVIHPLLKDFMLLPLIRYTHMPLNEVLLFRWSLALRLYVSRAVCERKAEVDP